MKRRLLCMILAFVMLCTMLPFGSLMANAASALSATPYPNVEYGYTPSVSVGTIRYIAQNRDSQYFSWNYWPSSSFGSYGSPETECGTACISMALSYVGVDRTPKALLEATNGVTAYMWGSQGSATSKSITRSTSAISSAMDDYINGNGKYSPLCVYIVPFSATSEMHWILLVGKLGENKYLALNPWHSSGTNGTFIVQINGTTATYNGITNPISSVNQWYNPNAVAYETAWFPAPQLYLTQLAYESYSHGSQNAIDIAPGGDVFAPFTGTVSYVDANWGYVVLQSNDKVYYADGTLDYMTVAFMHDENISDLYKGKVIQQGTAFYQAGGMGGGDPNAYADHVHLSVHKGQASGITSAGKYGAGDVFAYNAFCVNKGRTSIQNQGAMAPNNYMTNGAPSNWNGLWREVGSTRPGKPVLNHTINDNKVTFTWNPTDNTTHYNLWIIREKPDGDWEYVEQIFYAESGVSRELEEGEYLAELLSYNSNAYESDGSDWVHTKAENVYFTIGANKSITYYDADGNVWLTEECANGARYSLSADYPAHREGYFSGWAYVANAEKWTVRPGDTIEITEDISLHPVYVSHSEAISGEAVLIYNIADFTQDGYDIEELEVTVQSVENVGSWTQWSDYTTEEIVASDTVQVKTTTLYMYYYFLCPSCGGREPFWGTSDCGASIPSTSWYIGWFTTPYSQCNHQTYSYTSAKYYTTSLGDGQIWNFSSGNLYDTAVGTMDAGGDTKVITTGYSSRTYETRTETVEKKVIGYKITEKFSKQNVVLYDIVDGKVMITGVDESFAGDLVIPNAIEGYPVTSIGPNAFFRCYDLESVTIPDGVTNIGDSAFFECLNLTKVTFANSVTSIGDYAFYNCMNLTDIMIPDSVISIGDYAFCWCMSLTSITIPDKVTSIGKYAFSHCSNLNGIWVDTENPVYTSDGQGVLFNKTMTQLIQAPSILEGSYNIPVGVVSIQSLAFYSDRLYSVNIPTSVISIDIDAFDGCTSLRDIYYSGTQKQWDTIAIADSNNELLNATLHCREILQQLPDGTLLLNEDWTTEELLVRKGQVLDLNGYVVSAEYLASFGQIIDSVGGGGLIVGNIEISDNEWLPIKDNSGCYRFYAYEQVNLGTKATGQGTSFGFAPDFKDATAYTTLLASDDVQVTVTLAVGENTQTYAFSKELIAKYVELVEKFPNAQVAMKLNVTGLESLDRGEILSVTFGIAAVGGKINKIGESMQYIA